LATPSADRLRKASGAGSYFPSAHSATFRRAFNIGLRLRKIFWTALSERPGGLEFGWAGSQRQTHLAMNLLLLLALAVPLSCLALLSLLALLGVMTLGGVIHVLGTVRARRA
jgi:hypothetical protein